MAKLAFVIPVRHQDNALDWGKLKANLTQTLSSIAAQTESDWCCVVVANEGADLPDMPPQVDVEWVTFAPNILHDIDAASREETLDAFRLDKGRRVLRGMLRARASDYFMIVDDDDFVSRQIVTHVRSNEGGFGWVITHGYVWNDGGGLLLEHDDFNHICGTSLIIRADLYGLPDRFELADDGFIMSMLGSHYGVAALLEAAGTPLASLPFRGAVYRVANPGSHSKTPGLLKKYVLSKWNWRRPWRIFVQAARIRVVTNDFKRGFFGAG